MIDSCPKLRWPLDIQHIESQGTQYVVLRDESGVAPEPAVFPAPVLAVIGRFDGTHSIADIVKEGAPYGLTQEIVLRLVSELTALRYLDTEETRNAAERVRRDFLDNPIREAAHAGRVYPAEASALRNMLDGYIQETRKTHQVQVENDPIVSIICPHIDYHRGWRGYGAAYAALEQVATPDVLLLIGTSHQASETLFHLTAKDFATPLGIAETDKEVVQKIATRYGTARSFRDEMLHRKEHSLELQLPFLLHRYKASMPKIVPILVGSFHQYFFEDRSPIEDPQVGDFVDALAEILRDYTDRGQKVLIFAGIDLAHVGLHFGDTVKVSDRGLPALESRDRLLLDSIMDGDEQKLFEHMAEDADSRRICGYPSMYTMFAAMRRAGWYLGGKCLEYRQAVEPKNDCIVTFASAYWTKQ